MMNSVSLYTISLLFLVLKTFICASQTEELVNKPIGHRFLTSHPSLKSKEGAFFHTCTTNETCTLIYRGSTYEDKDVVVSLEELVMVDFKKVFPMVYFVVLELTEFDVETLMKADISALVFGPNISGILSTFKQRTGQELKYVILPKSTPLYLSHTFRSRGVSIIVPSVKLDYRDLVGMKSFKATGFVLVDMNVESKAVIRQLSRLFDEASVKQINFSECIEVGFVKHPALSYESKISSLRNHYSNFPFKSFHLIIDKDNLFIDTIHGLVNFYKTSGMPPIVRNNDLDALSRFRLDVEYFGEEGVDYRFTLKDWYTRFMKETVGHYKFLSSSPINSSVIIPIASMNHSGFILNGDRYDYINIIGRLAARSIIDSIKLEYNLPRYLLKMILGLPLRLHDLEEVDPELYEKLCIIYDSDLDTQRDLFFETEIVVDGTIIKRELFTNGSNLNVTEANKAIYIKTIMDYKMDNVISKDFVDGFHSVMPMSIIKNFTTSELDELISGTGQALEAEPYEEEIIESESNKDNGLFWDIMERIIK